MWPGRSVPFRYPAQTSLADDSETIPTLPCPLQSVSGGAKPWAFRMLRLGPLRIARTSSVVSGSAIVGVDVGWTGSEERRDIEIADVFGH